MTTTDKPGPAMSEGEIVEIGARAVARYLYGNEEAFGEVDREFRAALVDMRAAGLVLEQGWRFDMENAPERNTFLAFVPPQGRHGTAQICVAGRSQKQFLTVPGAWAIRPTAWRPLPAPPTERKGSA